MASKAPHLEAFIDAAIYFIGITNLDSSLGREMLSYAGQSGYSGAWCAVFVSACAAKAGILNEVIASDTYAIEVQRKTVDYYGGEWIEGPAVNGGAAVTPMPGDLITFGWSTDYTGYEHASHIGIVEYVEDGRVHTIEGNTSGQSKRKDYDLAYECINMYVRPNWASVGDDVSGYLASGMAIGPLYQNRNDRHDMTLREVGYLNDDYELVNKQTGISISVINYTSLLGDLYDMFAPAAMIQITVDTSQLVGNTKIAMDFLLSLGLSASASSGITGCLLTYSKLDPAFVKTLANGKILEGIAAWEIEMINSIRTRIGYGWNTDLTSQLQFLMDDLQLNYKTLLFAIKTLSLTPENAKATANSFMLNYNKHYIYTPYIDEAKQHAADIYGKLIITQTRVMGSLNNLIDMDGNRLSAQFSVSIPSDLPQTGIIDDYTSYSAWFPGNAAVYDHWAAGTVQQELAFIWQDQGFPCDSGIAMIGGYYCVAVREHKFGVCGDVLVVTLEDDISFPAIICDEKGDDAGSEWGHVKEGGKISIIEWERVKTNNGVVEVEWSGYTDVDPVYFGEWGGKKVVSITNYGSYI